MAVEDRGNGNGNGKSVKVPRWLFGLVVGSSSLVAGAALSWAVNIDSTQRCLLQDVARLQSDTMNFAKQLERIENKVDQLERMNSKLDAIMNQIQERQ